MIILFLLTNCPKVVISTTDWSPVITTLPGIIWGAILLAALYLVMKYVIRPCITNFFDIKAKNLQSRCYELENTVRKQKEQFEKEKNELLSSTDDGLRESKKDIEEQLNLEKNKNQLLEKKLKLYEDQFTVLNLELKTKEKS